MKHREFLSSDLHLGHDNILKYTDRPYKTVGEMNEAIISNWNALVAPQDHVYVLGDICMGNLDKSIELLYRLNGKLFLIIGNHDEKALRRERFVKRFEWIKHYHEDKYLIDGKEQKVIMFHFPIASWHHAYRGAVHVHGHCHASYHPGLPNVLDKGKILDVGLDAHGCKPISFSQMMKIMDKKIFLKTDGHEKKEEP